MYQFALSVDDIENMELWEYLVKMCAEVRKQQDAAERRQKEYYLQAFIDRDVKSTKTEGKYQVYNIKSFYDVFPEERPKHKPTAIDDLILEFNS